MSNNKHFADLLKVCSILPALAIMPAMANNDPFLSGNAFVLGDVVTNNTISGGVRIVSASPQTLAWPEYKMVARSFELNGINGGKKVYFGPIDLTVRELDDNEEFTWNSQRYDESGNPIDFDLAKYNTDGSERENKVVWNNANGVEELGAMDRFLTRDDSKEAGKVNVTSSDVVMAGSKIVADEIVFSKSSLNIVKDQEALGITSDGVAEIFANKLLVKDDSKIVVAADASLVLKDNVVLKDNDATGLGGAIHNSGSVVFEKDVEFSGNSATSQGGAIYNAGEMEFEGAATFTNNTAAGLGNVFANAEGAKMTFNKGIVVDNNGAILESGMQNGIQTSGELVITGGDAIFTNNKASGIAGISAGSKLTIDAGQSGKILFEDNTSRESSVGLYSMGSETTLTADLISFKNNIQTDDSAKVYGAAVYNGGAGADQGVLKLMANNIVFEGNEINGSQEGHKKIGGAAIYNRGGGDEASVTETFVGLEDGSSKILFKGNSSAQHGGAIFARTDDGVGYDAQLTLTGDINFDGNNAGENGGAIMNWTDGRGGLTDVNIVGDVSFKNNIAGQNGGAIYNTGTIDLSKADAEFENNKASVYGGAIYNEGTFTINDAEFENNTAVNEGGAIFNKGDMTIKGAEFDGNIVAEGYGGAIKNGGTMVVENSTFKNNLAYVNGAFATSGKTGQTKITGSKFINNYATADGGALGLYLDATVSGVVFENNIAGKTITLGDDVYEVASNANGGGALYAGQKVKATLTDVKFLNNESGVSGGAVSARHNTSKDGGYLKFENAEFAGNKAANYGGALESIYDGEVYFTNANFYTNSTGKSGGAIYNGVDRNYYADDDRYADSTNHGVFYLAGHNEFVNNTAGEFGGAIFNDKGGTINMSGENIFSGNTAGKYNALNDIHNLGTLNIVDGTTTFTGGVSGDGVLTLADGATLDIGTSTIKQSVIELNGNVIASLVNNQRGNGYGRFDAETITVGENAEFTLNVGAVGTYNIWGDATVKKEQVKVGNIYEIAGIDANGVKIVTKSVEDIAKTTGVSAQAINAVVGLANSQDSRLQQISLMAQQALNAGDTEMVERESKKLNPETKPVAQSVASSVQNQVLSLATGRMSGAVATGRAGGDESQENGFWMHGLFNKSKMNGQFHGYTRGVAFGMDTVIDGKYTLGGGLAFNSSDVHSDGRGHTDINSKTLFLYGQYKPSQWFANVALTYSLAEYDEETTPFGVVKINNVYDVDSYGAQLMTGYDFATGVTTEAGLRYLHIAQDAYANTSATDTDLLTGVAGLKYAFSIENDWPVNLRPELRAALTYDFVSEADAAVIDMPGVASYKVAGESLDRLGGEFGIGLTADYKGLKISLMYDLNLHQDYTSQTGMIKLRSQF